MALFNSYLIWEIQTSGNDSYGGAFNPSNTNMATDGAATSATGSSPVFSSASYSFAARDVGHWLFIKSGTNWLPGWYQISSVSGGNATLNATAGQCPQYAGLGLGAYLGTTTGCATTASPTGATWTVDYSQSAPISYTDLVIGGSNTVTSVAQPFGKNFVGNCLSITGGTGFTVQRIEINSVTTVTAFLYSGSPGTVGSTGGTGYVGGPLLTWGKAAGATSNSYSFYVKSGTYVLTTATSNVSGGVVSWGSSGSNALPMWWEGYGSYRCDMGTRPILQFPVSGVTAVYGFTVGGTYQIVKNITIDCNGATGSSGVYSSSYNGFVCKVHVANSRSYGIRMPAGNLGIQHQSCTVTGAQGNFCFASDGVATNWTECEAYSSSCTGFSVGGSATVFNRCIAAAITGANGFDNTGTAGVVYENCVAYACADGFKTPSSGNAFYKNCYAEGNSGYGFNVSGANGLVALRNCGGYSNTSGNYNSSNIRPANIENFVTVSGGTAFTNAASGDFSLNNIANRGAALRAAGYPGSMPRGTTTGYVDIGIAQHQDSASGGGGGNILSSSIVTGLA